MLMLVLCLALGTFACTPVRGGGGGGGGGGDGDPDEPGVFGYTFSDYYDGYYTARLLLPLEDGFDCDDAGGYFYDQDYNYVLAYLYRGSDRSWEGSYDYVYDSDCNLEDYDYANLHCWGGTFYDDGNEIYADAGDALRIDSYSNSSVRGQIRIGGETHDFTVLNCGETSYYDRGERGAAGAPEASTGADRPFKTDRSGRWGLRFR